jgi:hypothetical protein
VPAADEPAPPRLPETTPDAAAANGPAPDAAPARVGPPVTGGPVPPCRFRFCESFESVADGAPPDPTVWRRAGNAVVAAGLAARGGKALRIRTPATPSEIYISTERAIPPGARALYGRVFFYIQQRPSDFFHWNLIELKGADARGPTFREGGVSIGSCAPGTFCYDTFLFQVKPQAYGGSEGATATDDLRPLLAEKTWHCAEWFVDTATREARLWWNGNERPKLHYQNRLPQVPFPDPVRLYVGWGLYQTGKSGVGWDVLIDEIAVDDRRIGCDP